ncbi:hypothetical protein GCM10011506_38030 [Marivirga lumbricoides]|uniref:5-bromo-4-chloroindolyl phosphate hydrolysis protein n=1 Tax=Marivirga lumbricoides TaxID=1046115 RepID=A0ABQ1N230_9BACT|nr:hypothetical protein GCM10011506_38030 [Marivirga lumbricoides]
MDEINDLITQYWPNLILGVMAFGFGFFTSYLKQRIKNKALLADIKRLEEEKQLVRKEHQLDIEKRKYKYESKREQFTKYFNLIDNFAIQSNEDIKTEFLPIINTYNEEFLEANGDKEKETQAITKFSEGINKLMYKANENLIRLRSETNGVKMIANPKSLDLLNHMDRLYDDSFELTSKLIKELSPAIMTNDFSGVQIVESEIKEVSAQLLKTKEEIIEQIRKELDEI